MKVISPRIGIVISLGIIAVVTITVLVFVPPKIEAQAVTGPSISGWAWSDMPTESDDIAPCKNPPWDHTKDPSFHCGRGMGWISLNNPGFGGGVSVDTQGNLSGYAWSEHAGWIHVNPSSGYPSGPGTTAGPAKINPTTGQWTGWIRAISPINHPQAGGWDGWISLRGNGYGVQTNLIDGTTSGWAWGDMVMGWINFQWTNVVLEKQCTDLDGDGFDDITKERCSGECLDANNDGFDDETGLLCQDDGNGSPAVQLNATACVGGDMTLSWVTRGQMDSCTLNTTGSLSDSDSVDVNEGTLYYDDLGVNTSYTFILECQDTNRVYQDSINVTCLEFDPSQYDCGGVNNQGNGFDDDGDGPVDEDCPRLNPIYIHR